MEKGRIFSCYHKKSELIENEIISPIQVNMKESKQNFFAFSDDVGINISEKNPIYCEITVLYWMWKNCSDMDYLGLFHYRRLLVLNNKVEDQININSFRNRYHDFGLDEKNIRGIMEEYDLVLPKFTKFEENLYLQYKKAIDHHIEHLDMAIDFIIRTDSSYLPYIQKFKESKKGFYCNLFIMKNKLLQDYCEWLFPILEYLEKNVDTSDFNNQEKRFIGYISERLFTIYMFKLLKEENIKCFFATRLFIEEVLVNEKLKTILDNNNQKVVVFGTGKYALELLPHMENGIVAFVDNDKSKQGKKISNIKVVSVEVLKKSFTDIPILICSSYYDEIKNQLIDNGYKENIDFFKLTQGYFY